MKAQRLVVVGVMSVLAFLRAPSDAQPAPTPPPAQPATPLPAAPPAPAPPAAQTAPAPSAAQPAPAPKPTPPPPPPVKPGTTVKELREEAKALEPLVQSPWVKEFLRATAKLPKISPRTIYFDAARTHIYSEAETKTLTAEERGALNSRVLDEQFYYNTRYGTPLAYARPYDLLATAGFSPAGHSVLDFGYGGIGQLRLLASLGADVVGVEVDPLTRAFYSAPSDQGPIAGKGKGGKVKLVHGKFPAEPAVMESVGAGYDLFIAKNVLKRGYIHPEQPVPERQRIDLGVDDAAFLKALFAILTPGGRVMIYNISPAPAPPDKPYIPWADGRSPFSEANWEEAGFRVLAFDKDDSAATRAMAHAFGWDTGEAPMDLQKDLFAHYTLVEKPAGAPTR